MSDSVSTIAAQSALRRTMHIAFARLPAGMLAALSTLCLPAASALAQSAQGMSAPPPASDTTGAAQLPAITVSGARSGGVAATTKMAQTNKETPQSITVIDQERMQEQNLRTLDEVMQQAPGITVQPYQQLTTAYYARGFKIDSFEEDGVPILMGNTAGPPQDMAMYERVEILRGANGLLHGSGNPAATVNLVPKRPRKEFGANGAVSAGSWDRYRAEADVGGPLNPSGSLRARMVASHEDRGYFYDVGKQRSTNFYGIGELDLGSHTTLSAGIQHQRIRSVTNMAGVPFYSDGGDIGLSRSTYLDAAWDRFDWDTTRVFAGLEHHFSSGWRSKIAANHLSGDAYLKYAGANGAIDRATGLGARLTGAAYRFDNSQTSVDAYATGPVELFGRSHELLIGANFQKTETEQYTASFVPPLNVPVNVFSWDPRSVPEPALSAYSSPGPTRIDQSGLYAMGRFSLADPLKLIAGVRLSQWKQETAAATTRPDTQFTPYGGLVYALNPQWSAYASYAQVFQPQTQMTWSGKALDPIEGGNLEAGVKGELAGGRLDVSLAAFNIRQKNRAQQDPARPCAGQACYYIAGGDVRSRGIEAEATGRLTRDLTISASYTYNTTKYLKDATSEGRPFASFTPRHIGRLWGNYTPPWSGRRLSIGLGVQAQSDYSVASGGSTLRQGGYALVSARIGYRVNDRLTAAINASNLFDRTYYQSLSGTSWNNRYGEPRSVMLTLRAEY